MKITLLNYITISLSALCLSCDEPAKDNSTINNTNITIVNDSISESDINNNQQINEGEERTEVDEIIDVANAGVNLIKEGISIKNKKDSIRIANKERLWVYQIGNAINDEDIAALAYDKLKEVPNIYIFKLKRHEYYLIKDDGYYSNEQLLDSMGSVKKRMSTLTSDRLIPIDLSAQCSSKKKPTVTNPIKYKRDKEKREVECRVCD